MSRWFNNLSIHTRLLGTFGLLLLIGLLVSGADLFNLLQVGASAREVYRNHAVSRRLAEIQVFLLQQELAEKNLLLTGDSDYMDLHANYLNRIEQLLAGVESLAFTDRQREVIAATKTSKDAHKAAFGQVAAALKDSGRDQAARLSIEESEPNVQRAHEAVLGLVTETETDIQNRIAAADRQTQTAVVMSIVGLGGFLVIGVMVMQLARNIVNPIQTIMDAASAVETETFAVESLSAVAERGDELGRLARVFQKMAQEVYAREQRMKQQIEELKIEIDTVKQAQQVSEIADTEFFQDLQQKAKGLRGKKSKSSGND